MKIKFHEVLYDLAKNTSLFADHLMASFYKGENSFDNIITDSLNTNEIIIYDDEGEVAGVYSGFTIRTAIYVYDSNDIIIAEFKRDPQIEERLDDLEDTVDVLAETILGE